jgi:hypothetical protein
MNFFKCSEEKHELKPEFEQALLELDHELKFMKKQLTLANFLLLKDLMQFAFIYGQSHDLDKARRFLKSTKGKK